MKGLLTAIMVFALVAVPAAADIYEHDSFQTNYSCGGT